MLGVDFRGISPPSKMGGEIHSTLLTDDYDLLENVK